MRYNISIICLLLFLITRSDKCKTDLPNAIYRGDQYITLDQYADSLKKEFDKAMTNGDVLKYAFVVRNAKAKASRQGGKIAVSS